MLLERKEGQPCGGYGWTGREYLIIRQREFLINRKERGMNSVGDMRRSRRGIIILCRNGNEISPTRFPK